MKLYSICTGNICRSAMANIVLHNAATRLGLQDQVVLDSAGVSNEEQGHQMDQRAVAVLREAGYDVSSPLVANHLAKQLTHTEALDPSTVFLAMTSSHAKRLIDRFNVNPEQIYMWRWFEQAENERSEGAPYLGEDLADPWYGDADDFRVALKQLEQSAEDIITYFLAT